MYVILPKIELSCFKLLKFDLGYGAISVQNEFRGQAFLDSFGWLILGFCTSVFCLQRQSKLRAFIHVSWKP